MVLLDRSEDQSMITDISNLKFAFPLSLLKMASVQVLVEPGFLSGAGFSAEQIVSGGAPL
jgi:hypothetical protein